MYCDISGHANRQAYPEGRMIMTDSLGLPTTREAELSHRSFMSLPGPLVVIR